MERNSSGALRAPGAFGAMGTSDPHAIFSSCSLHITHVCWLAAVLWPSAAAPLTTPPPAAPAPPASQPLFSACKFVAVLWQAVRVCLLSAVLRPSAAAPLAARPPAAPAPPAPLSGACGSTAVLPNPSSLAGDNASAVRYTSQRTRAWDEKSTKKTRSARVSVIECSVDGTEF
jgi:hypothetical protein